MSTLYTCIVKFSRDTEVSVYLWGILLHRTLMHNYSSSNWCFRELVSNLLSQVLSVSLPSQLKELEAKPWWYPAIQSIQPSSLNAPSKKQQATSTVRAASGREDPRQDHCFWKRECSACDSESDILTLSLFGLQIFCHTADSQQQLVHGCCGQ